MKILLYSDEFPPYLGGIATASPKLVNGMAGYSHKVVALVPSYGPSDADIDSKLNCKVIRIPFLKNKVVGKIPIFRQLFRQLVHFVALFYCLLKEKPEVVLFLSVPAESSGGFLSKFMNFKAVVRVAGSGITTNFKGEGKQRNIVKKSLLRWTIETLYKKAERIIAVSNYTKSLLTDVGVDGEKISVIYNGISRELLDKEIDEEGVRRLRNELGIGDKDKVIITVSRIELRKGQDNVIRALPKVRKKIPNIKYVVVGEGKHKAGLEELSRELKVENNVIFTGSVENSQIKDYLDMSDLFVMPNRDWRNKVEGLPFAVIEASARGLPVIAGNSTGSREAVAHNETGLLIDSESVDEIGDAIVEILLDGEKAKRFSANGRAFIENVFMEEKMIGSYVEVLEEVAGL